MQKERRFYAYAHSAAGESMMLGRVAADTRQEAVLRYFQAHFSADAGWFADGFASAQKLSVETCEKEGGEWVPVEATVYICETLRSAADQVLNGDRRKGRRSQSEMAEEATRRVTGQQ